MVQDIAQQVAQAIRDIKKNPVHMEKMIERGRAAFREAAQAGGEVKRTHEWREERFFDPGEDITVYVDFCSDK